MTDAGRPMTEVLVDGVVAACSRVEVSDSRLTPIGRTTLVVDLGQVAPVVLKNGATIEVSQGYELTGLSKVFKGTIKMVDPGEVGHEVTALDKMAALDGLKVRRAFTNATFQEAVGSCLDEHQVAHVLSSATTRRARHFVVPNLSLLQVLNAARGTWGVRDWDLWADVDGKVWCGPWAETERAKADPVGDLEWGSNLLAFEPSTAGSGVAETLLAPGLEHSRRVRLWHRNLWQGALTVRVDRATHIVDDGVPRTRFEWTLVN